MATATIARRRFTFAEVKLDSGETIPTVKAPVILAARANATDRLVTDVLDTRYAEPTDPERPVLMSREDVAN